MSDQSAATEQDPQTTLAELFELDPLKLTDRDLDRIIEELRKDRARYLSTGKGTTQSSRATGKKKEVDQQAVDLLAELNLIPKS